MDTFKQGQLGPVYMKVGDPTLSPGRFSLALDGWGQSQGKEPWGRGWGHPR